MPSRPGPTPPWSRWPNARTCRHTRNPQGGEDWTGNSRLMACPRSPASRGGVGHFVPIEGAGASRTTVRLASPPTSTASASAHMRNSCRARNSSISCRALPRKAPSSDLRCASGPMLSIPSSGRLALYSDTAWQNPPWVYGAAARGANSSNAPSGQYQLARTLVTDPQSPPPPSYVRVEGEEGVLGRDLSRQ